MFQQKRRSMLGRRHLLAHQLGQSKPVQSQPVNANGDGSGGNRGSKTSWRGRQSGKKKTPIHLDKAAKDINRKLFSKSPGLTYMGTSSMQGEGRNHYSSNENLLNETGISIIAPTPTSSSRHSPITPATAQRLRVEMAGSRYGPTCISNKTLFESDKLTLNSKSSFSYNFDNLKPPDSPGPSRLERLLLEEKLQDNPSSYDFDGLKPPASPGPSRLNKIIMEEKLEQPLDPDFKKTQNLSLEDPTPRLQFSPPLSSTCIASPDSGKKLSTVKEEIKEFKIGSARKLCTIKEDCDLSVVEFELNERTIINEELDETIKESNMKNICDSGITKKQSIVNNTVKLNNDSHLKNTLDDHNSNHEGGLVQSLETMLSRLDNMECSVMKRALNYRNELENLKQQIETLQKNNEKQCQEDISNIKSMKKTLSHIANVVRPAENKENHFSFRVPTCKKKQLDEEGKWLNSVRSENPGLLKTPNPNRRINHSSVWTPHSLSKVLHDQMNNLYD